MDPITIAMGLATVVPGVLKWLGHENAAKSAEKIVTIAQAVTGTSTGDAALDAVKANPTLALQLQQELNRHEEELRKIEQTTDLALIGAQSKNLTDVATTMQAEAAADHWPTYSWRPFIGFSFGCYVLSLWLLPLIGKQPVTLPPDVTLTVGAILGVASFWRGKMQADPRVPSDNRG